MPEPLPDQPGEVYRDVNSGAGASTLLTDSPFGVYQEAADDVSRTEGEVVTRKAEAQPADRLLAGGRPGSWSWSPSWRSSPTTCPSCSRTSKVNVTALKKPPSGAHWFGTDNLGRDIFSRSVYGARLSLAIAGASIVIGLFFGGLFGLHGRLLPQQGRPGDLDRRPTSCWPSRRSILVLAIVGVPWAAAPRTSSSPWPSCPSRR